MSTENTNDVDQDVVGDTTYAVETSEISETYVIDVTANTYLGVDDKYQSILALPLLAATPEQITKLSEFIRDYSVGKVKITGKKKNVEDWLRAIQTAFEFYTGEEQYGPNPFARDGAHWQGKITRDNKSISPRKPSFHKPTGSVSGEAALTNIRASLGLGQRSDIPLWHSGMWVRFKAPSDLTLLELDRTIAISKAFVGAKTQGIALSAESTWFTTKVLDMIFNHIESASYNDISQRALEQVIYVTDIPQLVWGIATTIWPNGHDLTLPCVHNPKECHHRESERVNIQRMHYVDNNSINPMQFNHLVKNEVYSNDSLELYRSNHKVPNTRRVMLTDSIYIDLKVPTIAEHRVASQKWVQFIEDHVEQVFGKNLEGEARESYLQDRVNATILRQYESWIESVGELDEEKNVIWFTEDDEGLQTILEDLSTQDELVNTFLKERVAFRREVMVSAIGVPVYDCSQCKQGPDATSMLPNVPEIVELDIESLFFTLHYMKMERLRHRL